MQLSSSPRSEAETTFPVTATPCLGYATIVRMAYAGADLSDLTSKLVARVQGPVIDPGALLDLSALLQCQGGDLAFEGRIMQRRAIQLQSNYAIRHGRGTGLRILAFVTAGDFMANTPLDFLLNGSDAVLLLHFVDANTRALDDLPPHDVAFMAIGESPENAETLLVMTRLLAHWRGPIFNNAASLIASLTRDRVSHLLAGEPSILAPATHQLHRDDLRSLLHGVQLADLGESLAFPLVLRPLGTHAGHGMVRILGLPDLAHWLANSPADQVYVVFVGQCPKAFRKSRQPLRINLGQRQGQHEGFWFCATSGQITQVHGQGFVPQMTGVHGGEKVSTFDQHVTGDGQLLVGRDAQQCAVVTHPQRGMPRWPFEEGFDQIKLTHKPKHNL